MKLPNRGTAVIAEEKVTKYLLSTDHEDGRHKAALFRRFGFSAADWETLVTALLRHAADHDVVETVKSPFGTRYIVEGDLMAPDGRNLLIRTVWFIDTDGRNPRLVTAYPM